MDLLKDQKQLVTVHRGRLTIVARASNLWNHGHDAHNHFFRERLQQLEGERTTDHRSVKLPPDGSKKQVEAEWTADHRSVKLPRWGGREEDMATQALAMPPS